MGGSMSRIIKTLVAAGAAAGLSAFGLMAAGAASAGTMAGATGPGTWSFDPGTGSNAITSSSSTTTSTFPVYQAQVQQPINPNGTSVWAANKGVIPVQFTLQQATDTRTTTITTTHYPGILESDASAYSLNPSGIPYGNLSFTPSSSTQVSQITNLTAYFAWLHGQNAGGSLRWQIDTLQGNAFVYYGDLSTGEQSGTGGSGVNMADLTSTDPRVDSTQLGGPYSGTWSNFVNQFGSDQVTSIALIVDGGWSAWGTQQVQLSDVFVNSAEYVPGDAVGTPVVTDSIGPYSTTTTPPMYLDLVRTSGSTTGTVDETNYTGVGDTNGQFAVVNGMYKYNLSASQLGGGNYAVYMDPSSAHNSPITSSPGTFILK